MLFGCAYRPLPPCLHRHPLPMDSYGIGIEQVLGLSFSLCLLIIQARIEDSIPIIFPSSIPSSQKTAQFLLSICGHVLLRSWESSNIDAVCLGWYSSSHSERTFFLRYHPGLGPLRYSCASRRTSSTAQPACSVRSLIDVCNLLLILLYARI